MNKIILPETSQIHKVCTDLVQSAKIIILTGLPGVGKSLFVQQLAVMAQQIKRPVYLLQWDVVRAAFETSEIIANYPEIDGVTHAVIRKSVGMWTRSAITTWQQTHIDDNAILIGEAPFVGERLMQLAKPHDDTAEALLKSDKAHFLLPVPTKEVRNMIEAKRASTIANPQHEYESKDAPPNVLEMMWHEIYNVGYQIGIVDTPKTTPDYDPDCYRQTYEHLLQHRHATTLIIDEVLTPAGSVYELDSIAGHLQANPEQVHAIMTELETQYTVEQVQDDVNRWYEF